MTLALPSRPLPEPAWRGGLEQAACWSLVGSLAAVALALAARRLSGALLAPLPPLAFVAAALALLAAVSVARWRQLRVDPSPAGRSAQAALFVLSGAAAVALLAAISLVQTAPAALAAGWLAALAHEATWCWLALRRSAPLPRPAAVVPPTAEEEAEAEEKEEAEADVVQQFTRTRSADGAEQVSGEIECRFAAGQRLAVVHVAFCPPLAGPPTLEAEAVAGPELTLKAAAVLPHGVRWEVRRPGPAREAEIAVIGFYASAPASSTAAPADRGG